MPLTPWISPKFPFHALASFKFPHDSPHLTGLLFGLYCQCNAMSDSYAGLPPPRPTQSTTDTRSHRRTRMKYSAAITREASFLDIPQIGGWGVKTIWASLPEWYGALFYRRKGIFLIFVRPELLPGRFGAYT